MFIATPHQGSDWTDYWLARMVAGLVKFPEELQASYRRLIEDNPEVAKEDADPPTSIDHLSPGSPIMQATTRLRFAPWVRLHSIFGDQSRLLRQEPSDDVVTIESARLSGVDSEKVVAAKHTEVQRHPEAISEVKRILHEHER